eukprot:c799_g1_i1.p1 GENE.c799_g1_i1~~c799_g1_i1.p1  ORF type:complete len:342 (-),score=107.37 c799_g1_i1:75-1034(-)
MTFACGVVLVLLTFAVVADTTQDIDPIDRIHKLMDTMLRESSIRIERGVTFLAESQNALDKASNDINSATASINSRINVTKTEIATIPGKISLALGEADLADDEIQQKEAKLKDLEAETAADVLSAQSSLNDRWEDEKLLHSVIATFNATEAKQEISGKDNTTAIVETLSNLMQTYMASRMPSTKDVASLDQLVSQLRIEILKNIRGLEKLITTLTKNLELLRQNLKHDILEARERRISALAIASSLDERLTFLNEVARRDEILLASAQKLRAIALTESSSAQHDWNFRKQTIQNVMKKAQSVNGVLEKLLIAASHHHH